MLSLAELYCLASLPPSLAFLALPCSTPSVVEPRETGSDVLRLCTYPVLPLLQQDQIQPFFPSSQMLWLPPAIPCCPLHRYWHPRKGAPTLMEATSPFQGEINPGKGVSSNFKIPGSSVLFDFVCEDLLFIHLETFIY